MAITHLSLIVTTITRGTRQIKSLHGGLAALGSVAVTVGVAAAGLAAAFAGMTFKTAIQKSMELSDELQALKAATGATSEEFEKMKELGFELGESMGAFTTPEAIGSMTKLAYAGFETNQIIAATPEILKLASAGLTDVATATDTTASVIRSFGMDASEANDVVDILVKTFISTNTMVDELGEAMSYVNPVAAALGFELTEVATALGIMANSGIKSSKAGTSLRAIMIRLAAPTTQARQAINDLNLELFEMGPTAQRLNQTIIKQTSELSDLELQIESTKAELAGLGSEMDKIALEESKNTLEIIKIREEYKSSLDSLRNKEEDNNMIIKQMRLDAAKRGEELTEEELARIDNLKIANDELSISYDKTYSEMEKKISPFEDANDGLAISQKEISIQIDEANIAMDEQKIKADELKESIEEDNDALNSQQGSMKSLSGILEEFNTKMTGLSESEKAASLNAIFGRRAIAGFLVLMNSMGEEAGFTGDKLDKASIALEQLGVSEEEAAAATSDGIMTFQELEEMLENAGGTAEEFFNLIEQGFGKKWKQFTSAIDTMLIKIGDQFVPVLVNATNVLKDNMGPAMEGLMTVIGPLVDYLDRLGTSIMNFFRVYSENEESLNKLMIMSNALNLTYLSTIAVFYLLAEGLIFLIDLGADLIKWLEDMGILEDVNDVFDTFVALIEEGKKVIGPLAELVGKELKKAFDDNVEALERIDEELPWLKELLKAIAIVAGAVVILFVGFLIIAFLSFVAVMAKITQGGVFLSQFFTDLADIIERVVMRWVNEIIDAFNELKDLISEKGLKGAIIELGKALFDLLPEPVQTAIEWFVGKIEELIEDFKDLKDEIEEVGEKIKDSPLGKVGEVAGDVGGGIVGGIKKYTPFAEGGIVRKPTFALIGEDGPEAVIPLNQNTGSVEGMGTTINTNDTINVSIQAQGGVDMDNIDAIIDMIVEKIIEGKMNQYSSVENKAVFG